MWFSLHNNHPIFYKNLKWIHIVSNIRKITIYRFLPFLLETTENQILCFIEFYILTPITVFTSRTRKKKAETNISRSYNIGNNQKGFGK